MNAPVNLALIPDVIKRRPQWVGFTVDCGKKTPCIADDPRRMASSTKPETWRPFDFAAYGLRTGHFDAVAYALNGDFTGVDLDKCLRNGEMTPEAAEIVKHCASFTEVSYSGTGVHILLENKLPGGHGIRQRGFEAYNQGRFLITTGNRLQDSPPEIRSNAEAIAWLLGKRSGVAEQIEQAEQIEAIASTLPASLALSVEEVIIRTLPKRQGERNHRLLDLARGLKFNAGLADRPLNELKPIVRRWFDLALPIIGTKDFTETWSDFTQAWGKAHHPLGDILTIAWQESLTAPVPLIATEYDSKPVRRLIGFCNVLARLSPAAPFFLSSKDAAMFLGVDPMQALRWLYMLIADGVLKLEKKGNERRANRYSWNMRREA